MATYQKIQDYVERLHKAEFNWSTHTFKAAFSNAVPNLATMTVLADISQIATGGGYTGGAGGGLTLDTVALSETSGTAKVTIADEVFTASGTVPAFRYIYIYDDTATGDPLVNVYDYGSEVNMVTSDTFTIDFHATNGLLQVA